MTSSIDKRTERTALSHCVDQAGNPIVCFDINGKIAYMNMAAKTLMAIEGREPDQTASSLSKFAMKIIQAAGSGEANVPQILLIDAKVFEGVYSLASDEICRPYAVIAVFRQVVCSNQAQTKESVSFFAHELRNELISFKAGLQLLLMDFEEEKLTKESLSELVSLLSSKVDDIDQTSRALFIDNTHFGV